MGNGECGINACNSEFRIPNSECGSTKKHPCPDCRFCQWCSEDRCHLCRIHKKPGGKKLSLQEQIALYDSLNKAKDEK
jgi:hypothetical protein